MFSKNYVGIKELKNYEPPILFTAPRYYLERPVSHDESVTGLLGCKRRASQEICVWD